MAFKPRRSVHPMAWVTKDSVEQYDHTPEPPKQYTKKEKAQNSGHYP